MVPFETSGMLLSKEDASGLLGEVRMVDADDGLAGEYTFRREIAKGATAVVFLGERLSDGHRVAIKRVSKAELSRVEYKRVRCECKRLGMLHHPNIVQLVEVVEERSHIFIITSFIDGFSVEDLLLAPMRRPKPMLEELVRRLFLQLLRVLDFMHNRDLVHRDIKPANLLVDSRFERLYLCDFGLCTNIDRARGPRKRAPCGTLLYAAPELLTTGVYLGPEIDMWSCGVTLFVMLTGILPFYHPTDRGWVRAAIRSGLYEWPAHSDVSDLARDLVERLLTVNPDERCTLEAALNHPWLQQPSTTDAKPSSGLMSRFKSSISKMKSPPPSTKPRSNSKSKEGPDMRRIASFDRNVAPAGRHGANSKLQSQHLATIELGMKHSHSGQPELPSKSAKGKEREDPPPLQLKSSSDENENMELAVQYNAERKTSASSFSSECEKVERVISFKVIEVDMIYGGVRKTLECHEAMTRKQFRNKAMNLFELPKGEKFIIRCSNRGEPTQVKSTEQLQKMFSKSVGYFEILPKDEN